MFSQRMKRERREDVIRSSLITKLKEAVQSVVQPGGSANKYSEKISASGIVGPILGHSDNTNALCNVLEAVFIHGLRDSLGERMSSFLGSDPDRMPVPNFWPVLLIISHRDLIEQVNELSFISSEVGRSRAWVRLALNTGQICSYLSVLIQDSYTLKDYYRPTAFFRDHERADIMVSVLQPVSSLTFCLATNAAVLNTWTQTPLVLAGLWAPSLQGVVSDPILAATDVASTVYDDEAPGVDINIPSTPVTDQMFDMIIGGTPETSFISDYMEKQKTIFTNIVEAMEGDTKTESGQHDITGETQSEDIQHDEQPYVPNRSSQDQKEHNDTCDVMLINEESQLEASQTSTMSSRSYMRELSQDSVTYSMIEGSTEYTRMFSDIVPGGGFSILPDLGEVINPASPVSSTPSVEVSNESSPSEVAERLNYEVLPRELPSDEDMSRLLPLLTRLTNEEGLDTQLYQCYQCKAYVGMIYGKPRLCSYDSKYYCYECHQDEGAIIPSRIVHNWDFNLYPVCCSNAQWLSAMYHRPVINLRTVNAKLYCHVEDLAELQMLRTQLLYLRAYLFTCRTDVGEKLNRMLWPREHLYEHVHLYSLADLQHVAAGQLVPQVRQAVTFGREHIVKCEVCSPRGFICELCTDNDIIYPFQLGNTHTCGECYGVYHSVCARRLGNCPRCVRRAARKERSTE